MPDSDDLRTAAFLFRRAADDTRAVPVLVEAASGPEVLSGGNLGTSLELFLAQTRAQTRAVAAELEELAAEADRLAVDAERLEREASAASAAVGALIG